MNLIDKDALIAEIESKKKYVQILGDNAINSSMQQFYDGMKQGCIDILSFLNTLEVKEVDLEKEIDTFFSDWLINLDEHKNFVQIARHFAEWQKQQMMKNAVDATVLDIDAQTIEFGLYPEKLLSIKEGDKVKIIITMED